MARQLATIWARNFYRGRVNDIDLIVPHCTQSPNPGARGVANYFAGNAKGSTQWVIDDILTVRCVRDEDTCWGAYGHNSNGMHYELCGQADWSRAQWLEHKATIVEAARLMAADMRKYRVPFVYPAPVVNGRARNGIRPHAQLPGNNHTDPWPGPSGKGAFPMDVLLAEIKKNLGLVHKVVANPAVKKLSDKAKREKVTVIVDAANGARMVGQGWKKSSGMLAWLSAGKNVEKGHDTVRVYDNEVKGIVTIIWQGKRFSSADPRYAGRGIQNVAHSIYSRFAD